MARLIHNHSLLLIAEERPLQMSLYLQQLQVRLQLLLLQEQSRRDLLPREQRRRPQELLLVRLQVKLVLIYRLSRLEVF
jgi:hypothetical protein